MACAITMLIAVPNALVPISRNPDASRNYGSTGPCSLFYQFRPPVNTGRRHSMDPMIKLFDYQSNHENPAERCAMMAPVPMVGIDAAALGAANTNRKAAANE